MNKTILLPHDHDGEPNEDEEGGADTEHGEGPEVDIAVIRKVLRNWGSCEVVHDMAGQNIRTFHSLLTADCCDQRLPASQPHWSNTYPYLQPPHTADIITHYTAQI